MKKPVITILCMFAFSFNVYAADQYIQNLKSQEINHYESLGYKFTNVGDGWHTLKPMEKMCFEVVKPLNASFIFITEVNYGDFRQEVAYTKSVYQNYKFAGKYEGGGYQEVGIDPHHTNDNLCLNKEDTEAKMCIQNVSRISNLYVDFPLSTSLASS